jgi:hypothetical protein
MGNYGDTLLNSSVRESIGGHDWIMSPFDFNVTIW